VLLPMRVLIFHGYLLRGTGSNVYNASLAVALARLGHEVHLLCQEREAAELDWVDSVGGPGAAGRVTVHLPDIGGLLPVYVKDTYAGFEVKTFAELSDAELGAYLDANVAAVREVIDRAGEPDAALANHLVMGPVVLARAGLRFAAKVHGSALEYTVKPGLDRFGPYAREGMEAASAVLVGSQHTAESLWAALDMPGLREKTRLGPPGVDTELFRPLDPATASEQTRALAARLAGGPTGPADAAAWGRDPAAAAEALAWFAEADGPRVLFVGKLIVSKGVDLLLVSWPLVVAANPGARLLIVGFGEYKAGLERLWKALTTGDLDDAREVAAAGWELEGGPRKRLEMLAAFLDALPGGYAGAAAEAAGSVRFAGRLEHGEVGELMPANEAVVFPSTFPEAFGMVAAEGAAAGVFPVSAAHSGLLEVSRELAGALPEEMRDLLSFELGPGAIEAIAARLNAWLATAEDEREAGRAALVETVARLWSWEGVARGVIAASEGRLGDLPEVPGRT
jgi:glycosyltransferase involved in cell wall biosynthesis